MGLRSGGGIARVQIQMNRSRKGEDRVFDRNPDMAAVGFQHRGQAGLPWRDGRQGGKRHGAGDRRDFVEVDTRGVERHHVLGVLHVDGLEVEVLRDGGDIHRNGQRQLRHLDELDAVAVRGQPGGQWK